MVWEGFLEVELSEVLKAKKRGRGPGWGSCVNNGTEMYIPGAGVVTLGQSG